MGGPFRCYCKGGSLYPFQANIDISISLIIYQNTALAELANTNMVTRPTRCVCVCVCVCVFFFFFFFFFFFWFEAGDAYKIQI